VVDGGSGAYSDVIIKACQTAGFDPIINGKCNGFDVVVSLVKSECSIAIVPGLLARFRSEICVKKLTPEMPRKISVAFRRRERSHPAISALLAQLQVCAKELC
jgi:DNA-binding transcriptional LysR family regulator